jgi:hypothetical protein
MIQVELQGNKYAIKTSWQDVSLSDYIKVNKVQKLTEEQFLALNPTAILVWQAMPEWCLETLQFLSEGIPEYDGPELPSVATSSLKKYWDSQADVADNAGLSDFELGAKVYANYMEMKEEAVLALPIAEVYWPITFFLIRWQHLRLVSKHCLITNPIIYLY